MSAVALKVSADLAATLRTAAEEADRSMSGQLEHWAKLGRAAEAALPPLVAAALKRCAGDLSREEDPALRQRTLAALEAVSGQAHFAATTRALFSEARGGPLFETDPDDSSIIIQVWPDGRRIRGRFVDRQFLPMK